MKRTLMLVFLIAVAGAIFVSSSLADNDCRDTGPANHWCYWGSGFIWMLEDDEDQNECDYGAVEGVTDIVEAEGTKYERAIRTDEESDKGCVYGCAYNGSSPNDADFIHGSRSPYSNSYADTVYSSGFTATPKWHLCIACTGGTSNCWGP